MKKWLIAAIVILVLVFLVAVILACVRFLSVSNRSEPADTPQETEQSAPTDVLSYAQTYYPDYHCSYDSTTNTLFLYLSEDIFYDEACSFGGNVYCDENAPETYLNEVNMIALAAINNCKLSALTVQLSYESSDGQIIFYVKSDGTIWTCWE